MYERDIWGYYYIVSGLLLLMNLDPLIIKDLFYYVNTSVIL